MSDGRAVNDRPGTSDGRAARRVVLSLVWANAAVLLALVLFRATGYVGAANLGRVALYSFAVANLTGLPCVLLLPTLLARLHVGPRAHAALLAGGVLVFLAVGCLVAEIGLVLLGEIPAARVWAEYATTMSFAVPLAFASGAGAIVYGGLGERARAAEQALVEARIAVAEARAAEERNRKLAAEARMRSLESRLQPHFLFNTLNSISALIASDPPRAEQLVLRLSALLRAALDATARPVIPLADELALVGDYLAIEQARCGERLGVRIELPEGVDARRATVPPLSVQTLVENAVKHGIAPLRGPGDVSVTVARRDGALVVEVSDSGPGFELATIPAGHGLDALVERLDALFGARAGLAVVRRDGRCVVEMSLPWE